MDNMDNMGSLGNLGKTVTEVELSLIGALLAPDNADNLEQIFSTIMSECFTNDKLRALYSNLREQFKSSSLLDTAIAVTVLGDEFKSIIMLSMERMEHWSLLSKYANLLFDNHRKRLLGEGIGKVVADIEAGSDTKDIINGLKNMLDVQNKLDETLDCKTSLCFLDSVIEYISNLYSKDNIAYNTGIWLLDYMLGGGFKPKEVTVLSGRSGMGKSDMAIFLATSLALMGTKVLYLTMEMPRTAIVNRIASRIAKIDSSIINQSSLINDKQKAAIALTLDKLTAMPLTLDEQQNITVYDIETKVKKHKPQVVIIDHIGLMAQDKYKKHWECIAQTSKDLKQFAMSQNISIIELVQQSSEVEKRKSKQGMLSDLKGTDGLGNDADNVLFIHADKGTQVLSNTGWFDCELQIVKNRNGKTGSIKLHWQPQYHTYQLEAGHGSHQPNAGRLSRGSGDCKA